MTAAPEIAGSDRRAAWLRGDEPGGGNMPLADGVHWLSPLVRPAGLAWLERIRSAYRLDTWGEAAESVLGVLLQDDLAAGTVAALDRDQVPAAPGVYGRARTALHQSRIAVRVSPALAPHLARIARRAGVSPASAAAALLEAVRLDDMAEEGRKS